MKDVKFLSLPLLVIMQKGHALTNKSIGDNQQARRFYVVSGEKITNKWEMNYHPMNKRGVKCPNVWAFVVAVYSKCGLLPFTPYNSFHPLEA